MKRGGIKLLEQLGVRVKVIVLNNRAGCLDGYDSLSPKMTLTPGRRSYEAGNDYVRRQKDRRLRAAVLSDEYHFQRRCHYL